MEALLQASGLRVQFGGLRAVDDVSFEVRPGELLGLIGPNGAGKTTCLKAVSGQGPLHGGRITLAGRAIEALPVHRRVMLGLGVTHQIVRPLKSLSVLDNVAFAWGHRHRDSLFSAALHVDRHAARDAARAILGRLGIVEFAERAAGEVPLGIRKRLEVARSLAGEPRLLLLDEPLAGLNSAEAARLADVIRSLADSGLSVLLIEHNLGEVVRVCDRLVVLETGRKIADGEPRAVMREPAVVQAYLGGEVLGGEAPGGEVEDARAE
ncbi:MAG: ABC transporter ATP-binding protein [Betaproteobacteria bacterium]|jgi:branched-chain amino acid transport system ATP-binding protein|nr:ABC transporter ATP-binding protein [Betaproteobacteria bacterium]